MRAKAKLSGVKDWVVGQEKEASSPWYSYSLKPGSLLRKAGVKKKSVSRKAAKGKRKKSL